MNVNWKNLERRQQDWVVTASATAMLVALFMTPANGQAGGGGGGGAGGGAGMGAGTSGAGFTTGPGPTSGAGSTTGPGPTSGAGSTAGRGQTSGAGSTTGPGPTSGAGQSTGGGQTSGAGSTTGPGATSGAGTSTGLGLTFGQSTGFTGLNAAGQMTNLLPGASGQTPSNLQLPLQITNANTLGQFPASNFAIGSSLPELSNFTTTFAPEADLQRRIFETQVSQFVEMNEESVQDSLMDGNQAASSTGRAAEAAGLTRGSALRRSPAFGARRTPGRSAGIQTFGANTPQTRQLHASVQEIAR